MKETAKKIRQELNALIKSGTELIRLIGKDYAQFRSEYLMNGIHDH